MARGARFVGRLALVVAGMVGAAGAQAAPGSDVKPNLRAGNWRFGIAMEVPNASGPSTGPTEYDRCLTPEDTRNLLMMPPGAQCRLRDSKLVRDSLDWRIDCNQGGMSSTAEGHIDFKDTRMEGRIVTVAPAQGIRITTQLSGRWMGVCVPIGNKPPAKATPAQPGPGPAPASRLPAYKE